MARNQKLINYHTGKKTEMPIGSNVDFGEIVVRHNAESPELLIKIGDDSFGVFQASGAVKTAIDKAVSDAKSTLATDISNLESKVDKFSGATVAEFTSLKTYADDTFATKTALQTAQTNITNAYTKAVGDAKVEIYNSATTFATNAVTDATSTLSQDIQTVDGRVTELSGVVESISTNIGENYVTTGVLNTKVTELKTEISTAKKEATDASSAYTDTKFDAAKKYTDDQIKTSETNTKGLIDGVASDLKDLKTTVETDYVLTTTLTTKVTELEGNISTAKDDAISSGKTYTDAQIADVKSDVTTLSANVESTINAKITNVYRYKGSCAYAALPTTGNVTGDVWNVTDANDNFPAGTNYAWDGEKWDALGGSIDLSPYATSASVKTEIDGIKQTTTNLQSAIDSVSSATKTLVSDVSAATVATYATKEELKSTSGSIITAYTQAVADAKLEAIGTASGYTDTQVKAAKDSIKQTTDAISRDLSNLSASTESIETTANSAIQDALIVDSATCKVSVSKVDTKLQFDFSNLVVDCGEF